MLYRPVSGLPASVNRSRLKFGGPGSQERRGRGRGRSGRRWRSRCRSAAAPGTSQSAGLRWASNQHRCKKLFLVILALRPGDLTITLLRQVGRPADSTCSQASWERGPGQKVIGFSFYGSVNSTKGKQRKYFQVSLTPISLPLTVGCGGY